MYEKRGKVYPTYQVYGVPRTLDSRKEDRPSNDTRLNHFCSSVTEKKLRWEGEEDTGLRGISEHTDSLVLFPLFNLILPTVPLSNLQT